MKAESERESRACLSVLPREKLGILSSFGSLCDP